MSDHKDMTHRHLRHKLQSVSRRLDELEEATVKLQKSEDELLDLQDKIIQAEGSNSSLLGEVEVLRKTLLKIQGKDEEVRKAEDLCRTVREKLEREESVTKELRAEIERLQRRMAELEKLEEAFGKSKSDCSQLCLSLNEEKNLTKKLSSELDALKARLKEMEGSETKLEKAEQALNMELEKLKTFTQAFVNERKRLLEKQREDEKVISKLTEKLELHKKRLGSSADPGHTDVIRPRIEDELSSKAFLTSKLAGRKKSLDYTKLTDDNMVLVNKSENEKNSGLEVSREEDNKVKELTQEIERLKNRLKQLEIVEEDLKSSESRNGELQEKFQMERNRARQLEDSSTRSSFDEELHSRTGIADGGHQGSSSSAIEIQRVYSPREALRSKAVIKPAIVEIDKKELMISEPLSANGKPKISTKPVVTTTSKMTSSITFYPNDPSSSRTSSRSSSVSSEPFTVKERHTSTSNILIGPNIEHHGSISVPYEISIPKSEITSWPCPDQDCGLDDYDEKPHNSSRVESATSRPGSQRSSVSLQAPYTSSVDFNDTESGFESSSSTTTVSSWRRQRASSHPHEDVFTDPKNVTVRSTWKTRGVASGQDSAQGRGDTRAMTDGGFEDDAENLTTWRAYRATTIDAEEMMNSRTGPGRNPDAQKGAKPSPAEKDKQVWLKTQSNVPSVDPDSALLCGVYLLQTPPGQLLLCKQAACSIFCHFRCVRLTKAAWSSRNEAAETIEPSSNSSHSPAAWRRHLPTSDSHILGSSKTTGAPSREELWAARARGSGTRVEGRSGASGRLWSHRQAEHQ
ncbi:unnamed protein product [Tetraodon nigroviridis]|uniref:(spotted green pufferfish) hypothetical protein n=1 Tax=Tetraodon nigroviridis TaxID=99883 RepID=Q4RMF9_TETNG|nr:unnamed protein product [Tetraodon nigroviridis]